MAFKVKDDYISGRLNLYTSAKVFQGGGRVSIKERILQRTTRAINKLVSELAD